MIGDSVSTSMLDWFFENHFQHIHQDGSIDLEVANDGLDDVFSRSVRSDIFTKYKDAAFSDEHEWRLTAYRHLSDPSVFFYPTGSYPTPRARVKAGQDHSLILEAIEEVICGPGLDFERSNEGIQLMAKRYLGRSIQISSSKAPYRKD